MTMQREMTDSEVRDQIERADAFREGLRDAIAEAIAAVNPHSPCSSEARAGLARISATLDAVPFVTFANLSNIDLALQRRTGTGLMPVVEMHLRAVGGGPTLDYADATAFLAEFKPMIDMAREDQLIIDEETIALRVVIGQNSKKPPPG
jgi:hypothetical protein